MKQNTKEFLLIGAATSVGQVRKANEDSMWVSEDKIPNMKVFVVCDGMGGHVGGKVASETAIAAIHEFLINNTTIDPQEAINNAIIAANEAILRKAQQQPELSGMGSTCVMLVVTNDGKAYYGHVGDSRIYIIANHRITQLTKDHSFVQALVDAGQITKAQAEHHPRKNEITNALGLPSMQPPTICSEPIEPESGYCFLLCSDGLTGMVDDEQIQRIISKHAIPIRQRAETLVKMANDNGGVDNITVELVEFALSTQQINGGSKKTANLKKMLLYLLPVLVLLGGLTWFLVPKKDSSGKDASEKAPYRKSLILKDSVEYKSSEWISLGVTIKEAEVDSCFSEYLIVKGIDNSFTSISFEWKEKKFDKDSITIRCNADSVIYYITIPVKYPSKTSENPVPAPEIIVPDVKPSVEQKYIEIVNDTVKLESKIPHVITFTDFDETKEIRFKNGETITSSEKAIEIMKEGKVKNNTINIIWIKGEMPPSKVVFTGKGENGTIYIITLHLKAEQEKPEKEEENDSEKYVKHT
jgi:protein phosphatase